LQVSVCFQLLFFLIDKTAAVHGGNLFTDAVLLTDDVIEKIEELSFLAPLHNPSNLIGVREAKLVFPYACHVAVFDTSFHLTLPHHVALYALPFEFFEKYGLRKYGFHGISHEYIAKKAAFLLGGKVEQFRLITLHLGNGCSVCAIDRGKSVDTSMGLSPLEGLIMGTRCGDVDATVGLRIAQIVAEQQNERHQENNNIEKHQISPLQRTESILNHDSGLKGICGISDMRELLTIKNSNPDILDVDGIQRKRRAQLAFEMFCYRVKKYIGAYFVALDGIDAIVFSAGIGENSAEVRDKICQGLECIGIRLSKELNEETESKCARKINAKDSRIAVLVVPTEEEAEIARIAKETAYKQQYISLF